MKLLLLLILSGCSMNFQCTGYSYPCPDPKYEPAPESEAESNPIKVGDCLEFIKASKDSFGQKQVIVKVIKVGVENYLLEVIENPRQHSEIVVGLWFFDNKDRVTCP